MTELPELHCAGRSQIYWHVAGSQELHCSLGYDVIFSPQAHSISLISFKPYRNTNECVPQNCSGCWVT